MSDRRTTLILLRHGEVASHRGDVPVTQEGLAHAARTGKALGERFGHDISMLYGGTLRTRQTAEAIIEGIGLPAGSSGLQDAFALRNPDLYVAGVRVNMVSSASTLAEQVPGMTEQDAAAHEWFASFFTAPDRIGWWLEQANPPGDNATDVARRITRFAISLADEGPNVGRVVVGVTHSPVLRAVLAAGTGSDPGEPAYVTGALIHSGAEGGISVSQFDPLKP